MVPLAASDWEYSLVESTVPTILFIDDDAQYGIMLDALLGMHGFSVVTAQDGLEGVKKARELQPDLILLDMYLPPTGGLGVVRELRDKSGTGDIPVVLISALPIDRGRQLMEEVGIQDFISKPFKIEDLIKTIRKYLTQHSELSSLSSRPLNA